jgi:VanZ family protein
MSARRAAGGRARSVRQWVPAVLWGVLILGLSTRPDSFFFPVGPRRGQGGFHLYAEIAVHLVEFCLFALLLIRALRPNGWGASTVRAAALAGVLGLSLLNESLQAVTPTRMFDVADVVVDAAGGLIALAVSRLRSADG